MCLFIVQLLFYYGANKRNDCWWCTDGTRQFAAFVCNATAWKIYLYEKQFYEKSMNEAVEVSVLFTTIHFRSDCMNDEDK